MSVADPVLKRVTLSTGGVGQFEYEAEVDGAAAIALSVPLDQVNDVLKSLRILDPAGSPISVAVPGRQPLTESFRSLPFAQEAIGAPETLLAALVGAEVRLPASGAVGTILGVSLFQVAVPHGGVVTRHRLSIATAEGMDSVVLEETAQVTLTDPDLRRQLAEALAAIARSRRKDSRTVTIALAPAGARCVTLTVVVAVPVWKASYRAVIAGQGEAAIGTVRLEGWAVVENLSGQTWRDVAVTLTSGQPVVYQQALYEPIFVTRPVAPVAVAGVLAPDIDQGAIPQRKREERARGVAYEAGVAAAPAAKMSRGGGDFILDDSIEDTAPRSNTEQGMTQVLFHIADAVSAEPGQSLLLPIVAADLPAERLAWYQPAAHSLHPLVALKLTNTGTAALPPGLVTLYERGGAGLTFIGDARLSAVPAGDSRIVSFALDLPVKVVSSLAPNQQIVGATAHDGVLHVARQTRRTHTYEISTPPAGGRRVLVDIEVYEAGYQLLAPEGALVERIPRHWRIGFDVPAGMASTIAFVQEKRVIGDVVLADMVNDQPLLTLAANTELAEPLRASLRHLAGLKAADAKLGRDIEDNQARQQEIIGDQTRMRDNLRALPPESELSRGYLKQMQAGEANLAGLRAAVERLKQERNAAREAYRAAVAAMAF